MSIKRINEFPEGSGSLSNDDVFLFMDDPSGGGTTKKISLSQIADAIGGGGSSGNPFDQDLNTTNFPSFSGVSLSNGTTLAQGTFDNSTGGQNGISLNCAVGYELNWQGGRLKSTYDNGVTASPIYVDSPMSISPVTVEISYSSTINVDAKYGDMFDIALTGNATLANPTNPVNGKTIRWRISQDATGGRTITLGNKFNIPSSASSPLPWSTAANKMDMLAATYHAGRDKWDVIAFVPGY